MNRAAIALGANLGSRLAYLRQAVASLGDLGRVAAVSSLYETAPVGGPEQGLFLNAVVVVDTDLDPEPLLVALHRIEQEAGRTRVERWGPRTLDLDLVTVVDDRGALMTSETPELDLPHPRAATRRFVLEPLDEVWPTAPLGPGVTASLLLPRVGDQDVERVATEWLAQLPSASRWFVAGQAILITVFGLALLADGRIPDSVSAAVVVGTATMVMGAALALWASSALGEALTPFPEPRPTTKVVAVGPYRWMRHPIYLGVILLFLGGAVISASPVGLAVTAGAVAFFWFKAGYEETRLRLIDPGYRAYSSRVRGRLFPQPGRRRC